MPKGVCDINGQKFKVGECFLIDGEKERLMGIYDDGIQTDVEWIGRDNFKDLDIKKLTE